MALNSRATSIGFAERTETNLVHLERAFAAGADVHLVTQLVNSLVGFVVFPWERGVRERLDRLQLNEAVATGWPVWSIQRGTCPSLWDLVRYLRNGLAHGHIEFSSDERELAQVFITVSNYRHGRHAAADFVGTIRADALRTFCRKFSDEVIQAIG